jgi:hypothetical protein
MFIFDKTPQSWQQFIRIYALPNIVLPKKEGKKLKIEANAAINYRLIPFDIVSYGHYGFLEY